MRALVTILKEIWGLFVDDAGLALALLGWCAVARPVLASLPATEGLDGPLLAGGCISVLIVSVATAAWRQRRA
jgi:hypothetical protein